jgi:prepilin-type processing-associated H-X9-DG protein
MACIAFECTKINLPGSEALKTTLQIKNMDAERRNEFKSIATRRQLFGEGRRAFTLTELLVVLGTLGVLTLVLFPAFASNQSASSKEFQCLNNMRQLGLAGCLYANDNHDRLASNNDQYPAPGVSKSRNWICPFGTSLDWSSSQKNTNTLYLTVDSPISGTALFGNYLVRSVTVFVCPADKYLSAQQQIFAAAGWSSRMRSCAMNGAFGDGSKYYGFDTDGNPSPGHVLMPLYYNAKKISDLHSPAPSACWMIMDEHPDSDDDTVMFFDPAAANGHGTSFTELPGSLHNGSAGMVFADGHSELHLWKGRITTQPVTYVAPGSKPLIVSGDSASQNDLTWLAQHTPAN